MSSTASWLIFISVLAVAGCATRPAAPTLRHADDFGSAEQWVLEAEHPESTIIVVVARAAVARSVRVRNIIVLSSSTMDEFVRERIGKALAANVDDESRRTQHLS